MNEIYEPEFDDLNFDCSLDVRRLFLKRLFHL